ncbi:hypothetical protein AAVH_35597 [Aphelenchoides avenae]|nr:hypothetical protein AAVH_35597 [Aphelenchus avenae]
MPGSLNPPSSVPLAETRLEAELTGWWLSLSWPVRQLIRFVVWLAKFIFKRLVIAPLLAPVYAAQHAYNKAMFAYGTRDYWFPPLRKVTIFLWEFFKGVLSNLGRGAVSGPEAQAASAGPSMPGPSMAARNFPKSQ